MVSDGKKEAIAAQCEKDYYVWEKWDPLYLKWNGESPFHGSD